MKPIESATALDFRPCLRWASICGGSCRPTTMVMHGVRSRILMPSCCKEITSWQQARLPRLVPPYLPQWSQLFLKAAPCMLRRTTEVAAWTHASRRLLDSAVSKSARMADKGGPSSHGGTGADGGGGASGAAPTTPQALLTAASAPAGQILVNFQQRVSATASPAFCRE